MCANDKLVITQKPRAILKIFHTRFLCLAVNSQVANYKINSRKTFPILHPTLCDNSVLIYQQENFDGKSNHRKRNNESQISQIVDVISLFIECFGVAAVFKGGFLNFNLMGKENNVHHSLHRNMFGNPEM